MSPTVAVLFVVVVQSSNWVYFDGNAISQLWDWHTEIAVQGQTGDPRDATPFADAVLSDFVLDEIITNPIDNSYLKHLLLLIVYPDIPILRALESVDLEEAQQDRSVLIRPPEYLKNGVDARTLAMCDHPEAIEALASDFANKQKRIEEDSTRSTEYVPKAQRVPFHQAVEIAVSSRSLNPAVSARDFFDLCMSLYTFEVTRLIDRPARERKGASRLLNQQIDYYHLSYVPFVDEFVTNDLVLADTASSLVGMFGLHVDVHTAAAYRSNWIRRRLLA